MKFKLCIVWTAALWLAGVGAANAVPAAWTDEFDPADVFLSAGSSAHDSLSFTLDLRQGADGFRPGLDSIEDALLTVVLLDDFDFSSEKVSFSFDGSGWTPSESLLGAPFFPSLFVFSPIEFLSDGLLDVSLKATNGDFYFDNAFLAAFGERAVPEPATLALFGVGLVALAWPARRRALRARS